jgi:hypothetical protein
LVKSEQGEKERYPHCFSIFLSRNNPKIGTMVLTCKRSTSTLLLALLSTVAVVEGGGGGKFNPVETLFQQPKQRPTQNVLKEAAQDQQPRQFIPPRDPFAPTPEEREAERMARRERNKQRHAKIQEAMMKVTPSSSGVERLSASELEAMQKDHPEFRKLWGSGGNGKYHMIEYADPGDDYDMWQQAYRMLGGFIDCDHQKSQGSGDHNNEEANNGNQENSGACSRWMMWASVSSSICCVIKRKLLVKTFHSLTVSIFLFHSTWTQTIKDTDTTNTLAMNPWVYWIATDLIQTGSCLEFIVKNSISLLNKSPSIFGPLMSMNT